MHYGICLLLRLVSLTRAAQIPLTVPGEEIRDDLVSWNISQRPDPDFTGHLIFDTVGSFLQHWPNTRYRNGHSIVPGIVPRGTLLYHGSFNGSMPIGPEWTATDPEHSLMFSKRSGWHLTLVTTRALNIIYFDGSSAAKMHTGPLDTQDILTWGEVVPDRKYDEAQRVIELCKWCAKHGFDGIVRMEMDFEVILCDFTVGVETVSFVELQHYDYGPGPIPEPLPGHPPFLTGPSHLPTPQSNDIVQNQPFSARDRVSASMDGARPPKHDYQELISGAWHNRNPGDTRIKLDLSQLISFYDTSLAPSLVEQRHDQERWFHRLENITQSDVSLARQKISQFKPYSGSLNGVDWETLLRVIVDRYANRLEFLEYTVELKVDHVLLDTVKSAYKQLKIMLQPYLLRRPSDDPDIYTWSSSIFRLCTHTHIRHLASPLFTDSERLMYSSIEGTNREICRSVVSMYVAGVNAGLETNDDEDGDQLPPHEVELLDLATEWSAETKKLMAWLDWSIWVKCKPACGLEEICYLPTWPYLFRTVNDNPKSDSSRQFRRDEAPASQDLPDDDGWMKPQPRCIDRMKPFL